MVMNKSSRGLISPAPLSAGDSVGIVAPSGKVDPVALEIGCRIIQAHGLVPVLSDKIYQGEGYFAGSDSVRAKAFMDMLSAPNIKAVVCARGGYGCMRMADSLDFDLIAANPKIIMGFSDNTLLLSEISSRSGLMTWHGPTVSSLGSICESSLSAFFNVLSGTLDSKLSCSGLKGILGQPSFEGFSVCGNLTTFCHTAGTPFQRSWEGAAVFIEDVNEPLYKIDRMITHMRLAGMFDGVRGIVLGDFGENVSQGSIIEFFAKEFKDSCTSVAAWPGFGHGKNNHPLPFGAMVRVDCGEECIEWNQA